MSATLSPMLERMASMVAQARAEYESRLERGLAELSAMFGRTVTLSDEGRIEVSPAEFALLREWSITSGDYVTSVDRLDAMPVVVVK